MQQCKFSMSKLHTIYSSLDKTVALVTNEAEKYNGDAESDIVTRKITRPSEKRLMGVHATANQIRRLIMDSHSNLVVTGHQIRVTAYRNCNKIRAVSALSSVFPNEKLTKRHLTNRRRNWKKIKSSNTNRLQRKKVFFVMDISVGWNLQNWL